TAYEISRDWSSDVSFRSVRGANGLHPLRPVRGQVFFRQEAAGAPGMLGYPVVQFAPVKRFAVGFADEPQRAGLVRARKHLARLGIGRASWRDGAGVRGGE